MEPTRISRLGRRCKEWVRHRALSLGREAYDFASPHRITRCHGKTLARHRRPHPELVRHSALAFETCTPRRCPDISRGPQPRLYYHEAQPRSFHDMRCRLGRDRAVCRFATRITTRDPNAQYSESSVQRQPPREVRSATPRPDWRRACSEHSCTDALQSPYAFHHKCLVAVRRAWLFRGSLQPRNSTHSVGIRCQEQEGLWGRSRANPTSHRSEPRSVGAARAMHLWPIQGSYSANPSTLCPLGRGPNIALLVLRRNLSLARSRRYDSALREITSAAPQIFVQRRLYSLDAIRY